MSKTLNDFAKNHVIQNVKITDEALATYIREAVVHIENRGEKLEDYSLIQVQNPMQIKDSEAVVTMQWRLIKTNQLRNIPTYEEGE